jgi:hypothetical protein
MLLSLADDIGESLQFSAALGATTHELLVDYEVPDCLADIVLPLNQALTSALSFLAHLSVSLHPQICFLRLENCKWGTCSGFLFLRIGSSLLPFAPWLTGIGLRAMRS